MTPSTRLKRTATRECCSLHSTSPQDLKPFDGRRWARPGFRCRIARALKAVGVCLKLPFYSFGAFPHIPRPMLPTVINILLVIHVLVSLLIILITLMQRPKNEGLGAAFGGGMTDNLFGAQTTNVLQTITRWLGGAFFGLTLLLSFLYVKQSKQGSSVSQKLRAKSAEASPAALTPSEKSDAPASAVDSAKPTAEAPAASEPAKSEQPVKPEQPAASAVEPAKVSEKTSETKPSDAPAPAGPKEESAQEQKPAPASK